MCCQSKDQKDSRKIDGMQRKCARLTESLQHWRTKISNNMKEAESRNKALKEEKDKVIEGQKQTIQQLEEENQSELEKCLEKNRQLLSGHEIQGLTRGRHII